MQFSLYNECITMKRLIQKRITECGNIKKKKKKKILCTFSCFLDILGSSFANFIRLVTKI